MCKKDYAINGYHYNENIIKPILFQYNRCKKMPDLFDIDENTHRLVRIIDGALEMLNKDYRLIINNDYIDKHFDSNWWKDYYSRTTYYRYKGNAVEELIHILK